MSAQPFQLRQPEPWAEEAVARSHQEALYGLGEYAMFVLLWNAFDADAGRVGRCGVCFVAYGKVAEAYGQSANNDCPSCYGTTYEGGYRARIIRPAIWQDRQTDQPKRTRRGSVETDVMSVETTSDFVMHTGDLVFRADGTRYKVTTPNSVELRTGFQATDRNDTTVGLNIAQARLEDRATVTYDIPPDEATLRAALSTAGRFPSALSPFEDVRGPLVV